MDQFNLAKEKFEARKKKQLEKLPDGARVNTTLPFVKVEAAPKKEKPVEVPRPAPKALEVSVSGPVSFKFSIDWSGTLMGGQMNEQTLKALFAKYLTPIGRVK